MAANAASTCDTLTQNIRTKFYQFMSYECSKLFNYNLSGVCHGTYTSSEHMSGSLFNASKKMLLNHIHALNAMWDATEPCNGYSGEDSGHINHLYFIRECGSDNVKVGFTNNVDQRMRTHQCGNASVLKLEYKEAFLEYRLVEDQVKRFLTKTGCHIHGEWFLLVDGSTDYKEIIELR